jgi:hypothetical protein
MFSWVLEIKTCAIGEFLLRLIRVPPVLSVVKTFCVVQAAVLD